MHNVFYMVSNIGRSQHISAISHQITQYDINPIMLADFRADIVDMAYIADIDTKNHWLILIPRLQTLVLLCRSMVNYCGIEK